jgi:hypothetical protein
MTLGLFPANTVVPTVVARPVNAWASHSALPVVLIKTAFADEKLSVVNKDANSG